MARKSGGTPRASAYTGAGIGRAGCRDTGSHPERGDSADQRRGVEARHGDLGQIDEGIRKVAAPPRRPRVRAGRRPRQRGPVDDASETAAPGESEAAASSTPEGAPAVDIDEPVPAVDGAHAPEEVLVSVAFEAPEPELAAEAPE